MTALQRVERSGPRPNFSLLVLLGQARAVGRRAYWTRVLRAAGPLAVVLKKHTTAVVRARWDARVLQEQSGRSPA